MRASNNISRLRIAWLLPLLAYVSSAVGQTPLEFPGYRPGTGPWIPVIDECMTAGGNRNDCIEALPPDLYAAFLNWEQSGNRRALMRLPRIPVVPNAADLPDIYRHPDLEPNLRGDIAAELAAAGCLIPRALDGGINVITGQFAAAGQEDVAVICSADGVSRVQIFWGGPASCPPLDETSPDRALLYKTGDWEYYWAIAASPPDKLRDYAKQYDEECAIPRALLLDHDALELIMIEKGSSNHYCHADQWHRFCGGD